MKLIRTTLIFFLLMTIITGILYPLLITVYAGTFFPNQANGSFINVEGKEIGSALIAQKFTNFKYFWPRPSAVDYNPMPSGGSNLAVSSPAFKKQKATASGSGLDPDISIEDAMMQFKRVANARHWSQSDRQKALKLIEKSALGRDFKILGEPRINVLQLNLELDRIKVVQ